MLSNFSGPSDTDFHYREANQENEMVRSGGLGLTFTYCTYRVVMTVKCLSCFQRIYYTGDSRVAESLISAYPE